MADDSTTDAITTGALLVGGGLVGFYGGRWFAARRAPTVPSPIARAAAPAIISSAPAAPMLLAAAAPTTAPAAVIAPAAPTVAPGPATPGAKPWAPLWWLDRLDNAAPVSSPDQVASAPTQTATAPLPGALPRTFDPIFEKHRGADLPIEYLRALAMKESGMDPSARGSSAWGILQIVEVVRSDYNRAHRTSHARARLLDPDTNVAIAAWLLRTIIASYQKHHADVPNLRPDWSNPRFVELLTFGWNAGWTERGGVGLVVGWLKAKGARDIDIDLVFENARAAHASKHLANAAKVRWCKGVAALHQRERALASHPIATPNA